MMDKEQPLQNTLAITALVAVLWLFLDFLVSTTALEWHGTIYLLTHAGEEGDEKARVAHSISTAVLVSLAWAMYLLSGYTVAVRAHLSRQLAPLTVTSQDQSDCQTLVNTLFTRRDEKTIEQRVQESIGRHNQLLDLLRRGRLRSRLMIQVTALLESRHLSGYDSLVQGIEASVEYLGLSARLTAGRLATLGDIAATLGLSGTVLGLIVGGKDLTNAALMGTALQAALLKTFVGFLTKLFCIYSVGDAAHRMQATAAHLSDAVGSAIIEPSADQRRDRRKTPAETSSEDKEEQTTQAPRRPPAQRSRAPQAPSSSTSRPRQQTQYDPEDDSEEAESSYEDAEPTAGRRRR